MPEPDRTRLVEEAADIFLMLREAPADRALIARREAFVARSPEARAAYQEVTKSWATATQPPRKPRRKGAVIAVTTAVILAFGFGPGWYNSLTADIETAGAPSRVSLGSGDFAHLDARTAITHRSEQGARQVKLLSGAAFFEVNPSSEPFIVRAGATEVRVLGTSFAVSNTADTTWVTVAEGKVAVSVKDSTWTLEAGDRLKIAAAGTGAVDAVDRQAVAAWRGDRIITDGMTFREVAAVLDRRLAGRVVILSNSIAETRLTGGYDLSKPLSALRAMAAAARANVTSVPNVVTLVTAATD